MLLSEAAGSTCSPGVKERRDSIPPGGLERARTSEEHVLVYVCVGAAWCGHWSEVDPFRRSVHHPLPDKLQHLSEMVLKDSWQ